jgi:predicted CXXCH cytochrome family protein
VIVLVLMIPAALHASDIRSTKHNLSVSGPGAVKALSEDRVCVFCHTPHNASPVAPLWNRNESPAAYTPYTSTSMNASPGQPTGASKLCLSCHDGALALGEVLSETAPITMADGVTIMPHGVANMRAILLDDHPISFSYTPGLAMADGELKDPATLTGAVQLDPSGEMQCTSCHDAHDDTFGKFLVMDNTGSAVCMQCHDPNEWTTSLHRLSGASWDNTLPDPWFHTPYVTVADNGCENCHNPHHADGEVRLQNYLMEELNCFACHNGHVVSARIDTEFGKAYVHPITNTVGVHDSEENPLITARHVECVDCHNPHAVEGTGAVAPLVSGALKSVTGVDTDGTTLAVANNEYEVCYKCHAGSPGKGGPPTARDVVEDDVSVEFDPSAHSYHPVEAVGVNPNVPSLTGGYTTGRLMYCTDCHNNDSGRAAGGVGPNGPHGSNYPGILGWRFETADNTLEDPAVYELCYRCHSRTSILGDNSFKEHDKHISGEDTSCNVCHDPHGVAGGNAANHSHLINFDTSVVFPFNNVLEFVDGGTFQGSCTLTCHGQDHDGENY